MDIKPRTVPIKKVATVPFNSTESEYISPKKSFFGSKVATEVLFDIFLSLITNVCMFSYLKYLKRNKDETKNSSHLESF